MDYQSAIKWLYSTQTFGIKLGLDNMRALIGAVGASSINNRKIIHVAGTNGKGSVCAIADSIFRSAGVRCGLFTSPHLITYRERIRVDGEMISEAFVAEVLSEIREKIDKGDWEQHPTFFEITLALACRYFIEQDCEVVVLETGMGGRLDATTSLDSSVSVITPIDLDHQQWLGDTIAAIAREKAGIIKQGKPCISSPQLADAAEVISEVADALSAPLTVISAPIPEQKMLGLTGAHQRMNAAVAIAAVKVVAPEMEKAAISEGLAKVSWPARFQRIRKEGVRYVVDGAHNLHAANVLARTWIEEFGSETKATLVFGAVKGKDTALVIDAIRPIAGSESDILVVKVNSERGLSLDELLEFLPTASPQMSLDGALKMASTTERTVLVTGSLFLAGETLALLQSDSVFESSEQ